MKTTKLIFSLILITKVAIPSENWEKILKDYKNEKFDKIRKELKENPIESQAWHFNLGTIYLKLQSFGSARAHLEIAYSFNNNNYIKNNLLIARKELSNIIGINNLDPASRVFEKFGNILKGSTLRGLIGIFLIILSIFLIKPLKKEKSFKKAILYKKPIILLILILITLSMSLAKIISHKEAFLKSDSILRSGPGSNYLEIKSLPSGVKVRVTGKSLKSRDKKEVWQQIRYDKSMLGWIKKSVLLISPN